MLTFSVVLFLFLVSTFSFATGDLQGPLFLMKNELNEWYILKLSELPQKFSSSMLFLKFSFKFALNMLTLINSHHSSKIQKIPQ